MQHESLSFPSLTLVTGLALRVRAHTAARSLLNDNCSLWIRMKSNHTGAPAHSFRPAALYAGGAEPLVDVSLCFLSPRVDKQLLFPSDPKKQQARLLWLSCMFTRFLLDKKTKSKTNKKRPHAFQIWNEWLHLKMNRTNALFKNPLYIFQQSKCTNALVIVMKIRKCFQIQL